MQQALTSTPYKHTLWKREVLEYLPTAYPKIIDERSSLMDGLQTSNEAGYLYDMVQELINLHDLTENQWKLYLKNIIASVT